MYQTHPHDSLSNAFLSSNSFDGREGEGWGKRETPFIRNDDFT